MFKNRHQLTLIKVVYSTILFICNRKNEQQDESQQFPSRIPAFFLKPTAIATNCHWKKKWVILTQEVESPAEVKSYSGFRVIGEYLSQIDSILGVKLIIWLLKLIIWLSSQFDSNILQLLGIPCRILAPVTQLFRSKWLYFSFSVTVPNGHFT